MDWSRGDCDEILWCLEGYQIVRSDVSTVVLYVRELSDADESSHSGVM